MWNRVLPVNVFNGERFKLEGDNHLTFTALAEPSVVKTDKGDKVRIRCRVSGKNSIRTLSLPYHDLVSVWNVDR